MKIPLFFFAQVLPLDDVPGDEAARYWFPENQPTIGYSSLSFPVVLWSPFDFTAYHPLFLLVHPLLDLVSLFYLYIGIYVYLREIVLVPSRISLENDVFLGSPKILDSPMLKLCYF